MYASETVVFFSQSRSSSSHFAANFEKNVDSASHSLCIHFPSLLPHVFPLTVPQNLNFVSFDLDLSSQSFLQYQTSLFFKCISLFVCLRQTLGEFEAVAIFIDISYISEFKVSYYHLDILDTCALSQTEQNIDK